jgi:hypothetical protein
MLVLADEGMALVLERRLGMGIRNEIHHAPCDVSLEVSTVDVDLSGNYESDKSTSLKAFCGSLNLVKGERQSGQPALKAPGLRVS